MRLPAQSAHTTVCAPPEGTFLGIVGNVRKQPWLNLDSVVGTERLPHIHEEICMSLAQMDTTYTGGSHKWMGIVPKTFENDPYVDYGLTIAKFSDDEFIRFVALSESPDDFDVTEKSHYSFGEDAEYPLSKAQMLYLKYRYGVYFPWKVYLDFVDSDFDWTTKNVIQSQFLPEVLHAFPQTVAFIRSLPFRSIGRCSLLGLEANDHGTVHRDNYELVDNPPVNDFISFCPAGNKDLFLWDEDAQRKYFVPGQVHTFNDMNYHGVEARPEFRYSIRVDGTFTNEFQARIRSM